ncbi:MAG: hypothetical protein ACREFP_11835 [Acetobacteraceae bacterium]
MADTGDDIPAKLAGPWSEGPAELQAALRTWPTERADARRKLDEALRSFADAYALAPERVETLRET